MYPYAIFKIIAPASLAKLAFATPSYFKAKLTLRYAGTAATGLSTPEVRTDDTQSLAMNCIAPRRLHVQDKVASPCDKREIDPNRFASP